MLFSCRPTAGPQAKQVAQNQAFCYNKRKVPVILFLDKNLKKFFIAALPAAAPAVPPRKVLTTFLAAAPVGRL